MFHEHVPNHMRSNWPGRIIKQLVNDLAKVGDNKMSQRLIFEDLVSNGVMFRDGFFGK